MGPPLLFYALHLLRSGRIPDSPDSRAKQLECTPGSFVVQMAALLERIPVIPGALEV